MKLLILSDSHREMKYMCDAVRRERPDAVIHLGDLVPDADRLAQEFPGLPAATAIFPSRRVPRSCCAPLRV